MRRQVFTSESVTEGHPDKVCDALSDTILDATLKQDPECRVACEALIKTGMVVIAGEITTSAAVDYTGLARGALGDIGYSDPASGFDGQHCAVLVMIDRQSPDIDRGVSKGRGLFRAQGAGDQGMMFGYACDETPEGMPLPILAAHRLTAALAQARKKGRLPFLRPDGKSQVSVLYEDDRPVAFETVVVSTQHSPDVKFKTLREAVIEEIIRRELPADMLSKRTRLLVNPTGRFVVGGPQGDCGLTGRKIIVDTYGGMGRHGGGAFSGKDPSKVDRSAAYMARYVAKHIVAAKLARRCELQLAYAIGYPEPVSIRVETFGSARVDERRIEKAVRKVFRLNPEAIIEQLKLKRPIYAPTAAYGHFGRSPRGGFFTWEKTDRLAELKDAV